MRLLQRARYIASIVRGRRVFGPPILPHRFNCQTCSIRTSSTSSKQNQAHDSLSTFLQYVRSTGLSPQSTIYTGTLYEYIVQHALLRLGMSLERTGGVSDKGIDLLGAWRLPTLPENDPLRVLVQCKALRRKAGPAVVRELEGAFAAMPSPRTPSTEGSETSTAANNERRVMGILASPLEATKAVREAIGRSRWPMGFAKICHDGRVEQLLWNKSAADCGLDGIAVTVRHLPQKLTAPARALYLTRDDADEGTGEVHVDTDIKHAQVLSEVVLTCRGEPWECDEQEDSPPK